MAKQQQFDLTTASSQLEEAQSLMDRHAELLEEQSTIEQQLADLRLGVGTASKRGRPAGKKSTRIGKAKSSNNASNGSGRTSSPEGLSVADHLVRDILPASDAEEGTTRQEAVDALAKIGVEVGGADPRIIIGQNFTNLKKEGLVKKVKRGSYVRSAKGDKYREELVEADKNGSEKNGSESE